MLTKLEEEILMTVWRFEGEGYGVNVFQHLERIHEKNITLGVVYDVMERLRKKGYLKASLGDPAPVRGGMRKKFYSITDAGIGELAKSKESHDQVMEGFNRLFKRYKEIKGA